MEENSTPSPSERDQKESITISMEEENTTINKPSQSNKFGKIQLPFLWQALPSLAIPDGAHNFESDTVFFHLPQLEDSSKTVYCVACYRQMATKVSML